MVVRGAEWQPQGGGVAPDIQIPEGGITSVEYGFINGAGRYYRGAAFGMSSRFLTDNAGDFFHVKNLLFENCSKFSVN